MKKMSFNTTTENPLIQQNPVFADTYSHLLKAIALLKMDEKSLEQQIQQFNQFLVANKEKIATLQQAIHCLSANNTRIKQPIELACSAHLKHLKHRPACSTRPKPLILQALKSKQGDWVAFDEIVDFVVCAEKKENLSTDKIDRLRSTLSRLVRQGMLEKQGERKTRKWRIKAI